MRSCLTCARCVHRLRQLGAIVNVPQATPQRKKSSAQRESVQPLSSKSSDDSQKRLRGISEILPLPGTSLTGGFNCRTDELDGPGSGTSCCGPVEERSVYVSGGGHRVQVANICRCEYCEPSSTAYLAHRSLRDRVYTKLCISICSNLPMFGWRTPLYSKRRIAFQYTAKSMFEPLFTADLVSILRPPENNEKHSTRSKSLFI